MELFWARGYEGVTLEDLQKAMGGITPPSFYNAFGSKEQLFREVADLYVSKFGEPVVQALEEAKTAREAIAHMLQIAAENSSLPGKPRGCMVVIGAMNCSAGNKEPQEYLRAIRQRAPKMIKQRLDRAVAEGELPKNLDTSAVAAFYVTVVQGIAIRGVDGASRAALMAAADGAMAAWDSLTARPAAKAQRRTARG
jgi:AcrR family transcriptional regulator